jgi:hypothetical protein
MAARADLTISGMATTVDAITAPTHVKVTGHPVRLGFSAKNRVCTETEIPDNRKEKAAYPFTIVLHRRFYGITNSGNPDT